MSWTNEHHILEGIKLLQHKQDKVQKSIDQLNTQGISTKLDQLMILVSSLGDALESLSEVQAKCCSRLNDKLDQILQSLIPPPAVKFVVTVEPGTSTGAVSFDVNENQGENNMAVKKAVKAGVDFVIQDNGTVKYTLTPVDAMGNATTLAAGTPAVTATSSDPALTLAADPAETSGFSLSWIGTPSALATGVVASFTATQPDGSVVAGSGDPVDIVAGPAGGFTVTEA